MEKATPTPALTDRWAELEGSPIAACVKVAEPERAERRWFSAAPVRFLPDYRVRGRVSRAKLIFAKIGEATRAPHQSSLVD